jgi:hypothetical protein
MASYVHQEEFAPPLPAAISNVLRATSLCYLATCEDNEPHLSLMNFSFSEDAELGGVLIMSTRCVRACVRVCATTARGGSSARPGAA